MLYFPFANFFIPDEWNIINSLNVSISSENYKLLPHSTLNYIILNFFVLCFIWIFHSITMEHYKPQPHHKLHQVLFYLTTVPITKSKFLNSSEKAFEKQSWESKTVSKSTKENENNKNKIINFLEEGYATYRMKIVYRCERRETENYY